MSNSWFIGDTHFNHENIIKYCGRPFIDARHMDAYMIRAWNDRVDNEDTVYHLGDFGLGNNEQLFDISEQLRGSIILITGNHDKKRVLGVTAQLTSAVIRHRGKNILLIHRPLKDLPPGIDIVFHGHIHEKHSEWPMVNLSVEHWEYKPHTIEEVLHDATHQRRS